MCSLTPVSTRKDLCAQPVLPPPILPIHQSTREGPPPPVGSPSPEELAASGWLQLSFPDPLHSVRFSCASTGAQALELPGADGLWIGVLMEARDSLLVIFYGMV